MTKFLLIIGGLLLFYVLGVLVRQQFGIGIFITNESRDVLHDVKVKVETRGAAHDLGDLAPGQTSRIFVMPNGESNINLLFKEANGKEHNEVVVGYVEKGYCGNASVTVGSDKAIRASERINLAFCHRSWLDFIAASYTVSEARWRA